MTEKALVKKRVAKKAPAKVRVARKNKNMQTGGTRVDGFEFRTWCKMHGLNYNSVWDRAQRMDIGPITEGPNAGLYKPEDLMRANMGDIAHSKARTEAAKAELMELELGQKQGRLYSVDEVREYFVKAVGVVASRVQSLSRTWAARANPANVAEAINALKDAEGFILQPLDEDIKKL